MVRVAITACPQEVSFAPIALVDADLALTVVSAHGSSLALFPEDSPHRASIEIVRLAIDRFGYRKLQFASPELKDNRETVEVVLVKGEEHALNERHMLHTHTHTHTYTRTLTYFHNTFIHSNIYMLCVYPKFNVSKHTHT